MLTQIILLLFGLHSISAHTIAKVEFENGFEVYKVKELADNTVEFINPKAKEPTLCEIVFYKVVEKPYNEQHSEKDHTLHKPEESPIDFDESVRPFTNSHGYQFVDWGQLEDEHLFDDKDDKDEDKKDKASDSANDDSDNSNNSDADDDTKHDDDATEHDDESAENDDRENVEQTRTNIPNIDVRIDGVKKTRNRQFEAMRKRYRIHKRNNSDTTENIRNRRQINYQNIPEAPILPDLDLRTFPNYIQNMLINRPSFENVRKTTGPELRYDNVYNNGPITYDNMNGPFPGGRNPDYIPRTYGMSLKGDQGNSWNHLPNMQNQPAQHFNHYVQKQPFINQGYNPHKEVIQTNTPSNEMKYSEIIPSSDQISDPYQNKVAIENGNANLETESNNGEYNALENMAGNIQEIVNQNVNRAKQISEGVKDRFTDMFANLKGKFASHDGNKPRTYGMNLHGDKGEIWNDIAGVQPVNIFDVTPAIPYPPPVLEDNFENLIPDTNAVNEYNDGENNYNDVRVNDDYPINELEENKDREINEPVSYPEIVDKESSDYTNRVDDLPPAPILTESENDYNQLTVPITTLKPEISSTTTPTILPERIPPHVIESEENSAANSKAFVENTIPKDDELKNKIEKSFDDVIKNHQLEPNANDTNTATDFKDKELHRPKTYGMHLNGDHGHVWNHLDKQDIDYNVGEMDTSHTNEHNNKPTTNPTIVEDKPESTPEPPTSELPTTLSPTTSDVPEYDERDKELTVGPVTTESVTESITTEKETTTETHKDITTEDINSESTTELNNKIEGNIVNKENDQSGSKDDKESVALILDDLLKKDEFWNWLAKWTITYIEVLKEHIKILVKDEVTQQLEKNCTKTETAISHNSDHNDHESEKDVKKPDDETNVSESNTTDASPEKNKNMDTPENEKNKSETINQTNTNEENNNNGDHGESKKGDKKLVNKEINQNELENNTSNTNTDQNENDESKPENESTTEHNNPNASAKNSTIKLDNNNSKDISAVNISGESIYGSTVGNDHVTNIFIFHPNDKTNGTTKSLLNDTNDILGKPVKEDVDDKVDVSEKDQNSSTVSNNEENKPDDTKKSNSSTPKPTESTATTTTSEPIKDNNGSGEVIDKESDATTTQTTTAETSTASNEKVNTTTEPMKPQEDNSTVNNNSTSTLPNDEKESGDSNPANISTSEPLETADVTTTESDKKDSNEVTDKEIEEDKNSETSAQTTTETSTDDTVASDNETTTISSTSENVNATEAAKDVTTVATEIKTEDSSNTTDSSSTDNITDLNENETSPSEVSGSTTEKSDSDTNTKSKESENTESTTETKVDDESVSTIEKSEDPKEDKPDTTESDGAKDTEEDKPDVTESSDSAKDSDGKPDSR